MRAAAPSSPAHAPGSDSPSPSCRRRFRYRTWSTSVDFPEPETPVTQTSNPSGRLSVRSLRLFSRAPRIRSVRLASGLRRLVRCDACEPPGEIRAGDRAGLAEQSRDRARVDELAALAARAGPEVDHVVGRLDERALVLDHDDSVAGVREPPQHSGETRGVARVQSHGRLVEHVERARERAAERGRQRHALRLAARERARLAAERQVAEAHVHQEAQPAADLEKQLLRRGVEWDALRAAVPLAEGALGLGHRQRLDLGQGPLQEPEQACLGPQSARRRSRGTGGSCGSARGRRARACGTCAPPATRRSR